VLPDAVAPLVAVGLQVVVGLRDVVLPVAGELQVAAAQVAAAQVAGAQVAAPRMLPTGAVISAPRMARAQRVAAPHKAHAQLRVLADSKVLVDSEALALDVPATKSLQLILSRVVAQ
jgi:hypothetical protein